MKKRPEETAKTRQKLMDSFWSIYQEKEIRKITVGEITKKAGYNRGTFYEYFIDIYDLLEQLETELVEQIKSEITKIFENGVPKTFDDFSKASFNLFSMYGDRVYKLVSSKGDPGFQQKFSKTMAPLVCSLINLPTDEEDLGLISSYVISALIGMIGYWKDNRQNLKDQEFFKMAQTLIATGVLGYTKKDLFEIP